MKRRPERATGGSSTSTRTAPALLDVRVKVLDHRVVVWLSGEADLGGAEELRAALRRATATGLPVRVDCEDLTFLDCAIVGVLMEAAAAADLSIGPPHGVVHQILTILGVGERLAAPAPAGRRDRGLGRSNLPSRRPGMEGVS